MMQNGVCKLLSGPVAGTEGTLVHTHHAKLHTEKERSQTLADFAALLMHVCAQATGQPWTGVLMQHTG